METHLSDILLTDYLPFCLNGFTLIDCKRKKKVFLSSIKWLDFLLIPQPQTTETRRWLEALVQGEFSNLYLVDSSFTGFIQD